MSNRIQFYCEECQKTSYTVELHSSGISYCSHCGAVMFFTEQELQEYINYTEPEHIVPFEKSMDMEK